MPHRSWMFRKSAEFVPKRKNNEAELQKLFCQWLDQRGVLYVASLMGVNLGPRVGAMRKRMGCKAGVPDILILHPSNGKHGMGIELKVKGGHVYEIQGVFKDRLESLGYYGVIMPPTMEVPEALTWIIKEVEWYLGVK